MGVGQLLREARQAAGLTQRELARRIDLKPPFVSLVESEQRAISSQHVERWLAACGADLAVMTPEKAQAVAALAELGDEDRLLAGRVLRGLPRLSQTFRDMLGLMLTQLEAEDAKRRTG